MDWRDDFPEWKDDGRPVSVISKSGIEAIGKLYFDDVTFTGEDEMPLWRVQFENGDSADLWTFQGWKFCLV
ncbi:hypothetical protein [Pseudomonas sp. AP42]|uniref:hypothetical protein n=1 Tax=Pseudomonas sp. AP42 TaxID=1535632 RepID=UPI00084A7565|nr:hypothetical protein [Pseudomonas sp. AP42]OEC54810.1 hypothetical protein A7K61_28380 [Pseudomonas sp. AP42]